MRSGLVQPAVATGIYNNLTLLQDTLSNLERIRNTPLPFAYQVHLRMSVWLYLCFLPVRVPSCILIYSPYSPCYLTVPNVYQLWLVDYPDHHLCVVPVPWILGDWTRNVRIE